MRINAYRFIDAMAGSAALFRLLGDDARLRILRLLDAERLNVTELTSILGIAQSGVSRHLGLLKDAGLVEERRDAGFTFFRLAPALQIGRERLRAGLAAAAGRSSTTTAARRKGAPTTRGSRKCAACGRRTSTTTAPTASAARSSPAGAGPPGRARSGTCCPPLVIADLGCGDGYLTIEASRFAKKRHRRSIARRPSLARAKALAARLARRSPTKADGVKNVEWKRGELEKLPLEDASVDVALLSQALHHAADPAKALAEAVRIVRPAAACCCSSCAATRNTGCASASATSGSASTTTS